MKLRELAHSRAGDKGNLVSISVIAYREEDYPTLVENVTAERITELLKRNLRLACRECGTRPFIDVLPCGCAASTATFRPRDDLNPRSIGNASSPSAPSSIISPTTRRARPSLAARTKRSAGRPRFAGPPTRRCVAPKGIGRSVGGASNTGNAASRRKNVKNSCREALRRAI